MLGMDSSTTTRLSRSDAAVLVIDLQDKLLNAMHEPQPLLGAATKLISAAQALGLAAIATEQYPAGLGPTNPAVTALLGGGKPFDKLVFSAWIEPVRAGLANRGQVIIAGIEAHVCVQQTVLDLLRAGKEVWVCADAVSSRRAFDRDIALERMRHAGAIITTVESVIFELLGQAGTDDFKKILKLIK